MVKKLDQLWFRGQEFLGTKYPILGGAMSWVSEHNLVSAISNAGAFGIIACGSMSPDMLEKEVKLTQNATQKPFGVNLIVMHPQIQELLDVCIQRGVSHVVFAGGMPKPAVIEQAKNAGIKVISFTPTLNLAKRLIRNGIDALIIEGMEAGGHIGPISTSVMAQEILPYLQNNSVPTFIAGGIAHGSIISNYLNMGASGCQMGTIFVCAKESTAHPNFKQKFLKASSRDTVVSLQVDENFPVIPVRAIKNNATNEFTKFQQEVIKQYQAGQFSKAEGQLKIEKYWAGALRKAVVDGDIESGSLMAGQSVGMVTEELHVQEIINNLLRQAQESLEQCCKVDS